MLIIYLPPTLPTSTSKNLSISPIFSKFSNRKSKSRNLAKLRTLYVYLVCSTFCTYFLFFSCEAKRILVQGRRKLQKARWAISNLGGTICPLWCIWLTDLPKTGWAISLPAHLSPTPLLVSTWPPAKSKYLFTFMH